MAEGLRQRRKDRTRPEGEKETKNCGEEDLCLSARVSFLFIHVGRMEE